MKKIFPMTDEEIDQLNSVRAYGEARQFIDELLTAGHAVFRFGSTTENDGYAFEVEWE